MADYHPVRPAHPYGHHSERGDRSYRAKIHANFGKGFDGLKAAGEMAAAPASVEPAEFVRRPEAVDKLRAELVALERNRPGQSGKWLFRKEDRDGLAAAAFRPEIAGLFNPRLCRRLGIPAFRLTTTARIWADQGRIELLEKQATRETKETRLESGVRLIETTRRTLPHFKEPSGASRRDEKHGFRWAPSGAWQRHSRTGAMPPTVF